MQCLKNSRKANHSNSALLRPLSDASEALRRCGFFFEVLSISLFEPEQCDTLPESMDENVCIGLREHKQMQKLVEKQSKFELVYSPNG